MARAARLFAWLYERYGVRGLIPVAVAGSCGSAMVNVVLVVAALTRYLRLSFGDFLTYTALAEGVIAFALFLTVTFEWRFIGPSLAWSGTRRSPQQALVTWRATTRAPSSVVRTAGILIVLLEIGPLVAAVAHAHASPLVALILWLFMASGTAANCVFVMFGIEFTLRPLVQDVATHLPTASAEPGGGLSLKAKAIAPIPGAIFYTGLLVGAFVSTSGEATPRLASVLGLALATGAIGISLFLLATRSALDPIDSLTEATRRVRDGDLKSRVPVLSGDELGTLAHSFNQMLDGLREREALRADLRESRARIVATADAERRRLERDLHDGAQQHLVLMNLKLATADRLIEKDPAAARAVHAELRHDLQRALEELRELAHGIYPQVLQADGLPSALREAVGRAAIPATLECDRIERPRPEVEAAVYFCCLEALQNASKHAGENASATVRLSKTDGMLRFEVEDTGGGFDLATREQSAGLQNMSDRIGALGGRLEITSAPGQGTTISGAIAVETEDRSEVDRGDGAA